MLWICFLCLKLHIGKGLGGVGKEGLSTIKVCLQDEFLFEDAGPFSNQSKAHGSTCVQFYSEITLIQSCPLSPCVTTLWHWMIKYSWKNVQGVCFSSTPLCICKTCDQMFMPWSFRGFVCRGVLGVCLACHVFWGKAKGYNFLSNKQNSGLKCELHSIPWMWFYCDPTEVHILI